MHKAALALLSMMVLCVVAVGQPDEPPERLQQMRARAAQVLERLERGETVRLTAFGDSLTASWGTDGRHTYHRIVADALQFRFPQSTLKLTTRGHPGETTADANRKLQAEVIAAQPDIVLLQFGGNDMGWNRSVLDYERDLSRLLDRTATGTGALVVACLAPIEHQDPNNVWSETGRKVAAREGIPAADMDRAIREGDADFRGPFAFGSHPGGFTHLIMAREVLRAIDEAAGIAPAIKCELATGSQPATGGSEGIAASITNITGEAIDCEALLDCLGEKTTHKLSVAPGETATITRDIALPREPFPGYSYQFPVRMFVRGGSRSAVDICWLTVSPAISAQTSVAGDLQWQDIPESSLTLGRHTWLGPTDLSARFAVVAGDDSLRFIVDVTDDNVAVGSLTDPSLGDSAEIYLDLRPDADQGKPVYGPEVIALQIIPPEAEGQRFRWRSMQPLPDRLSSIKVVCALTAEGYRTQVDLPLDAAKSCRGGDWSGMGFDVGVNDADFGGTRECQMMWSGFPDNYINPAYLPGLYADPIPAGATRRTRR